MTLLDHARAQERDSAAVAHEKDAKQGLLVQQKPPARAAPAQKKSGQLDGFECSRIDGLARPLLVAKGSKGYAACAYITPDAADKFGEACVIFSGVATHAAFLDATVAKASKAARALGVTDGMPGRDALALIK